MYSTSVKIYTPRQTVVLYSGSSPRRYQAVYSKNIKINKGVDNKIQFQFINQDQKPVDITGKTFSCRIMNYNKTKIIVQKALTPLYTLTGIATLDISMSETLLMDNALCHYSISIPTGEFEYPVFVDDTSGAGGVVDVIDSIMPQYVKSSIVEIKPHDQPAVDRQVVYSTESHRPTDYPNHTMQIYFNEFVGTFKIQGSPSGLTGEWYDLLASDTYDGYVGTEYVNIDGYHAYIKAEFDSTGGTVSNIWVR